jgi:hypothetical protein
VLSSKAALEGVLAVAVSKIDWDFWLAMPKVKAWQAVALSLSVDPDKIRVSPHPWMAGPNALPIYTPASFPNDQVRDEYDKRLRLLTASLSDKRFTAGTPNCEITYYNDVYLSEVAIWLKSLGRSPIAEKMLPATADPIAAAPAKAPHQKLQAWQEDQILRTARALGFNPLALPPDDPRKNFYVKALIRERCEQNHKTKMRPTIFNKAWDRMMSSNPKGLKYS